MKLYLLISVSLLAIISCSNSQNKTNQSSNDTIVEMMVDVEGDSPKYTNTEKDTIIKSEKFDGMGNVITQDATKFRDEANKNVEKMNPLNVKEAPKPGSYLNNDSIIQSKTKKKKKG